MAVEMSEALKQLLDEPIAAIVGTTRKNGTVQLAPIWFGRHEDQIWLSSFRGSDWARHIEEQGTATLLFLDPKNMYHFAEIQVRLLESTDEGGFEHINELSYRYTGGPYQTEQQRFILKTEPTAIKSRL